jgi:hypothetical protein
MAKHLISTQHPELWDQHHNQPAPVTAAVHISLQKRLHTYWNHQRRHRHYLISSAVAADVGQAAQPLPEHQGAWQECIKRLQVHLDFTEEEATKVLTKAFGWGSSRPYWRDEKKEQMPSLLQVESVLDFLAHIGVDMPADQQKLIKSFPEVLGLSPDLMRNNVVQLATRYDGLIHLTLYLYLREGGGG